MRALTATDVMEAELRRVADAVAEEKSSLFICRVGAEWLALRAELVEAVTDDEGRSRVPGAPAHIAGVITHRDQVVAVVDVATLCSFDATSAETPAAGPSSFARTLIVTDGCMRAGLHVAAAAGLADCVVEPLLKTGPAPSLPAHALDADALDADALDADALDADALDAFTTGWCATPWGRARALNVTALLEAARVRV